MDVCATYSIRTDVSRNGFNDNGRRKPVNFPDDAATGPGIPRDLVKKLELQHGEVVCAVTISHQKRHVYTGGEGIVKIWDITNWDEPATAISTLECLQGNYIRSMKLLKDGKTLVVAGETSRIAVFDVVSERITVELDCGNPACYNLVLSADEKLLFSCGADGRIDIWDLNNFIRAGYLRGHQDGASCAVLANDNRRLWSGGLDCTVRSSDLREGRELQCHDFNSRVLTLGCFPTEEELVAVGLENSYITTLNASSEERYSLDQHKDSVLSLKFAQTGKWFISTGKDKALNIWRTPYGYRLLGAEESSSVLSCDISADDSFVVTGSVGKASVYEVLY